jgi:hypothetical protein
MGRPLLILADGTALAPILNLSPRLAVPNRLSESTIARYVDSSASETLL